MVTWTSRADRLDDAALLAAIALDDHAAATVFVRRHQQAVYGLAVTMCPDTMLAQDVAQQTFERVWRHAGSYDVRRGSATTWLLTITRRLCIDLFRAKSSKPTDPDELLRLLPPSPDSVEDTALARTEAGLLRAAVNALSPEQRRAVVFASMGGHTAAEIAEIEHIPLGTAKTRLRQGLIRLRADLPAEMHDARA